MEKITKDNIGSYYELINDKIDQYISRGVSPSALKRYFKIGSKGLDNFLKKEDLDGVKRIEQVVHDVIDDRIAKEEASLMTFENFKHNIFNIRYLIKDDEILKILSDKFKVSIGRIEQDHNFFKINDLGNTIEVIVFDESKVNNIIYDLAVKIYEDFIKKTYSYENLIKIDFDVKNKIDSNLFIGKIIDEKLKDDILNILSDIISISTGERFKFKEKVGDFIIFKKTS